MDYINDNITQYAENHSQEEPELLREIHRETHQKILQPRMMSGHLQGRFLSLLSHLVQPKNILEIGAGYTTPFLLEALINNQRVYDDGNLEPSYFNNYNYDPKLVVIDNMSLGKLLNNPGMKAIISSKYTDFIEGGFEGKANILQKKYDTFDFVWFDCGGANEYEKFIEAAASHCVWLIDSIPLLIISPMYAVAIMQTAIVAIRNKLSEIFII